MILVIRMTDCLNSCAVLRLLSARMTIKWILFIIRFQWLNQLRTEIFFLFFLDNNTSLDLNIQNISDSLTFPNQLKKGSLMKVDHTLDFSSHSTTLCNLNSYVFHYIFVAQPIHSFKHKNKLLKATTMDNIQKQVIDKKRTNGKPCPTHKATDM